MTQLKKKVQSVTEVEVDIALPYFSKYGDNIFYAIISETECWQVETFDFHTQINKQDHITQSNALSEDRVECTQQEFWEAYSKAMEKLSGFPIEQPLFKEA